MVFRNSTTVSAGNDRKRPSATAHKAGEPVASYADLGFPSKQAFNEFNAFLSRYLAYNSDIMEMFLALASLKCFPMEPCHQHNELNLLQRLDLYSRAPGQPNAESEQGGHADASPKVEELGQE